jgi:hypothetical protein
MPSLGLFLSLLAMSLPHPFIRTFVKKDLLGVILVSIRSVSVFHQSIGEYLDVFPS